MKGNNPGNLRKWGTLPVVNGFAVFPSIKAGLEAMLEQLRLYNKRGIKTIQAIVNVWAPTADHNNTSAYIARVTQLSGYTEHQVLDMTDPTQSGRLMYAMIVVEQGGFPFSPDLLRQVVGLPVTAPLSGKFPPAETAPAPVKKAAAATPAPVTHAPPAPAVADSNKQAALEVQLHNLEASEARIKSELNALTQPAPAAT